MSSVLRDASSRSNSRSNRSSSVPRRMSYSCSSASPLAPSDLDPTEKKDRRALLDEWRKQARTRNSPSPALNGAGVLSASPAPAFSSSITDSSKKRARFQNEQTHQTHPTGGAPPLPLPPSTQSLQLSGANSTLEGTTAVERYRLRKQKQQEQQRLNDENNEPSMLPPQHPQNSRSLLTPNKDDFSGGSGLLLSSRSSSSLNRRLSVSGKAKKARRKTLSSSQIRDSSPIRPRKDVSPTESSPTSIEQEDVDSVEGAGLRSRIVEMQQRVSQLEKEKMALSMSKAPLEARFRQKEEAWLKDQNKLLQEIESLKVSAKETDERHRALENQYSELEEESSRLRLDARRAASTAQSQQSESGTWNRRLQNDRDVQELREKLQNATEEIRSLKLDKVSLESEVGGTQLELDSLIRNFNDLQIEYEELEASKSQDSEAEIQLQVLTTEHIATSAQLNAVCADLAATKSSSQAAMDAAEKKWKEEYTQMKFEISVLKTRGGNLEDEKGSLLADNVEDEAVLRARIEERDTRVAELEAQLTKGEEMRRIMHNRIQELRGNIRVFVRTRPFLPGDGNATKSSLEVSPDGESLSISEKSGKSQNFGFDKVFPPSTGQDTVFQEVSGFVQSALDGYHVCLFSYGQTGSGKTHTMQGSGNSAMRGIIPRAVEQILTQTNLLQNQKWQFSITASFLEIYNEDLRDLLSSMDSANSSVRKGRATRQSSTKLAIKRDANGKSYVDGLTQIKIDTNDSNLGMEQLDAVMAAAARSRSVAKTNMNAQSSRSHSVFMLHINGFNEDSETAVQGALNLCDLAGSERLDRSGAGADARRLKETQAINKSLSCLGDVFNALANKSKHVPYRNSKLTYLLQDCLSGDGKALMFVNLSPTIESSNESLCSLRFAKRVNQIELGKPTKNVQYGSRR